jgi:hypothetical protein
MGISQFSKIFTRNFFIHFVKGIVPPIYDKYDILWGGGIPSSHPYKEAGGLYDHNIGRGMGFKQIK